MNKYTFNWSISPAVPEYAVTIPPFDVVLRGVTLALTTKADEADEQNLRQQADLVAHNLARVLSYQHRQRFDVTYRGYDVETPNGRNVFVGIAEITLRAMCASCDFEVRDGAGNVTDSSALRREREQQAAQRRFTDLLSHTSLDANLRDMLDHWSRYVADPDHRLQPLYDVLEVAERLYEGRKKAALSLNIKQKDLDDLARICNDSTLLYGRHPGQSPAESRRNPR